VRWQGEPLEFGRRLHWEACRGGLGRAEEILVLGDGSGWIWNLQAERWAGAKELLDFYHGSEHLWELARAQSGVDESKTKSWVEPRLHRFQDAPSIRGPAATVLHRARWWARLVTSVRFRLRRFDARLAIGSSGLDPLIC